MRQGETLALGAGGEQHGRRRGRLSEADRGDVVADELHRVVDREQRRDVAARAVDVEVDVLVGVLRLEVDQLGADQAGDLVVDRRLQEDDVVLEQAAVQVVRPLSAARLLDDVGDEVALGIQVHDVRLCGSGGGGFGDLVVGHRVAVVLVAVVIVIVVVVVVAEQLVAIEGVAGGIDEVDVVEQPVERLGLADLGADLDVDTGVLVGAADTRHLLAGLHGDRAGTRRRRRRRRRRGPRPRRRPAAPSRDGRPVPTPGADVRRTSCRPGRWPTGTARCRCRGRRAGGPCPRRAGAGRS